MPRGDKPPPRPMVDSLEGKADKTGTFIAYGIGGKELFRREGWRIGRDKVTGGLSIGMRASVIIGVGGEVLHRWDPWGELADRKS